MSAVSTTVRQQTTDIEEEVIQPWMKYRYLAVSMAFLAYITFYGYRINMSIAIVAMVNNSALAEEVKTMRTESSCLEFIKNSSNVSEEFFIHNDGEFLWSPELQGHVLGISYLCYIIMLIPAGWLTDLLGYKKVLVGCLLLSSLFTFLTPFSAWCSVYLAIAVQGLRGMSQAGIRPALCLLVANWLPKPERGTLLTFINTGSRWGILLASYLTGILSESTVLGGWPSSFYVFGASGIIFALLAGLFLYENPRIHPKISKVELQYIINNQEDSLNQKRTKTPWLMLLTSVPVYALGYVGFGMLWATAYHLVVHPIFLNTILHYSVAEDGLFSAFPFVLQAFIGLLVTWFTKVLIEKNYITTDKSRKICTFLYCTGYSVFLLGVYTAGCNRSLSVVFAALSNVSIGFAFAGCMLTQMDMSPSFSGSIEVIALTIGGTAMYILPLVVGYLTDGNQTIGQWNKVMFISIAVVMSSGIVFAVYGSSQLQPWNDIQEDNSKKTDEVTRF